MSFLNPENKKVKNIVVQKCIYCKKKVKTCNDIPICSRKECKKLRVK